MYHFPFAFSPLVILLASPQLQRPAARDASSRDRPFALFNFIHAAEHEGRQITLHEVFNARFFRAEPLTDKLSLSLLRGLLMVRGNTRKCFVE